MFLDKNENNKRREIRRSRDVQMETRASAARMLASDLEIDNAENVSIAALYRTLYRMGYYFHTYKEEWMLRN